MPVNAETEHRDIAQELQFFTNVLLNVSTSLSQLRIDRIPFIDQDDDAYALIERHSGNVGVLRRDSFRGINEQQGQVRSL